MNWAARRQVLLAAVGGILFALAASLAYLQLFRADYYTRIATENQIRVVPLVAPRGRLLDRHGTEIVINRPAFSIAVLPGDFRGDEPRRKLASVLDLTVEELTRQLTRRRTLPLEPVSIRRDADLRVISRLEERVEEFPGVMISTDPVREYPRTFWAGHLLGYMREVSDRDRRRSDRAGGRLRGEVGATGLERRYDEILRGFDGVGYLQMNALGQITGPMPDYDDTPPIPGDDLMLTIDVDLQHLADSLLTDFVAGTVIALDVSTGGVLCFVTRPGYDPNRFIGGMTTREWESLRDDPLHPLLNRATMGLYPPGSTTKLITAAAALEAGIITANDRFAPCTGGYQFGNRVFHCWNRGGHGALGMIAAIAQSCDVYFYQVGIKLGLDRWSEQVAACGFGTQTGIDLSGEAIGIVPSRSYYDRLYGQGRWSRGLMLNLAIGQGEFSVTPIQLVVFFAAVANGGVALRPHLLLARRAPGQDWVQESSHRAHTLPWSPETLGLLQRACREVVQGVRGTAHAFDDDHVRLAGKTGTAQNSHGEDHAWFAGYAPADVPQIAVVALVENVGHGSTFAAPICYKIARAYLGGPSGIDKMADAE